MPRGERPLGSEDLPLVRLASDLRTLRREAGNPTYRELAAGRRGLHRVVRNLLADRPEDAEPVLVTDQFEELFRRHRGLAGGPSTRWTP